MFLQTNDRLINLQNVSNINILRGRRRIVFNMNYSIEIDNNGKKKLVSDYAYWDAVSDADFELNIAHLENHEYFQDEFIRQQYVGSNVTGYINLNEISSIKFSDKKNRVIFNLANAIMYRDQDNNERLTSDFVYVNCGSTESYNEYKEYVESIK